MLASAHGVAQVMQLDCITERRLHSFARPVAFDAVDMHQQADTVPAAPAVAGEGADPPLTYTRGPWP